MEKLIVKNFGPIKEAEIDLTKYVVFIGDTSTGKSVLAKLIAIFRDNDIVFTSERLNEFNKLLEYYNIDFDKKKSRIEYYFPDGGSILYYKNNIEVYDKINKVMDLNSLVDKDKLRKKTFLELNDKIRSLFGDEEYDTPEFKLFVEKSKNLFNEFIQLNEELNFLIPIYIPAERILTSVISSTISGLWANNVLLPSCYKDFTAKYDLARKKINDIYFKEFNLKYSFKKDLDYIKVEKEDLLIAQSSSGIQALIPLLLVIDYEITYSNDNRLLKNFIIEEPELNLFPIKQKKLIEFIISKLSSTKNKMIMTTHSPYILSVLDTLLLAKNAFNEHPELKSEIESIISEDKWIDYNDISVYEVKNDGTIQSIRNEEFKSIDTNAIDRVSDIISEEFDKLTELRYAQ